ncbi:aminoacyl tRNA synthase complex-interacting multifunctional protein 1-like [Daphnia carinata]|uniref:aminoacyl tRNA synthase complex-interacting multifunctional protein 1-like n=1 Tax=Daphnia carinata TaxID=120202 RepID=UPI002580E1B3|nr:aminoacyl tRNA synthase complex-interacting multifunctional protein 1-like [Daphnia carinata]
MSSATRILLQLEQKAIAAESLIFTLKNELLQLERTQNSAAPTLLSTLKQENENLKKEVEIWKQKLIQAGISHGVRNFSTSAASQPIVQDTAEKSKEKVVPTPGVKKIKELKKGEAAESGEVNKVKSDDGPIDIGRIDLRIGKIVAVKKHPDADSLYVEEVDLGEEKTRTIVSGLVKHVPIEEMQNRIAVFMCNLKPAKMRGITSEGMLMCASTSEKVEILLPPNGAVPGDLVEADGYVRCPDPVLNPKKKIWETVAPDLKTNAEKIATFKGAVLSIPNKGPISAATLANVQIK